MLLTIMRLNQLLLRRMQINQINEVDLFDKLVNLNHDLAKIKKKTAKMQIDLSIMLKINNEIAII